MPSDANGESKNGKLVGLNEGTMTYLQRPTFIRVQDLTSANDDTT